MHFRLIYFVILFTACPFCLAAQMITGSWKGRINRQKVEVKIIQQGDSLKGTAYYFESTNNYRRYSIEGYFDSETNSAVWWDDQLIEEKTTRFSISNPGKMPLLSRADFNCPGGGRMMLDGKAVARDKNTEPNGEVHLNKTEDRDFEDEWDFVIDNYIVGANDPDIIDSVAAISGQRPFATEPVFVSQPIEVISPVITKPEPSSKVKTEPIKEKKSELPVVAAVPVKPVTIEEKFISRSKLLVKEIPLTGDSLELRFYDNAEIDGDSISLFLNNELLFRHIRLSGAAYTIKLPVAAMKETNELTMVAENLGAIPPNTSYMLAIVDGKRYDAYLASTEGSSAMIRFIKKPW